jgi:dihydropteroate synthase
MSWNFSRHGLSRMPPSQQPRTTELEALPATAKAWLQPVALLAGDAARAAVASGWAMQLAGNAIAFAAVEILTRRQTGGVARAIVPLARLQAWQRQCDADTQARIAGQLAALSGARPDWAGLSLARPLVMGIVNVTPDSFSDGGNFLDPARAIAHGRALMAAGADMIDVGGESTRPGATPIDAAEELRRVTPVIGGLAQAGAAVSIDSRHAEVMVGALAAGARIVNDISALTDDPGSLALVARAKAPVVLMHKQGDPRTMQADPHYDFAPLDVAEYLESRIDACEDAGIPRARIVVDPGIGFGKTRADNLAILARLTLLHALGSGVLVGLSRKSVIGGLVMAPPGAERLPGSLAGALAAAAQGVQILRVHDVAETRQALAMAGATAG